MLGLVANRVQGAKGQSTNLTSVPARDLCDDVVSLPARAPSGRRAPNPHVLFMDDDEHIRVITGGMLESLGYPCDLAFNGAEAIKLYQDRLAAGNPYGVVIMDLNIIGGMGGEEVFQLLHKLDPEIRAIIASGYDNEDKASQLLELGFRGYLAKPYRIVELDHMVKAVLE